MTLESSKFFTNKSFEEMNRKYFLRKKLKNPTLNSVILFFNFHINPPITQDIEQR